MVRLVDRDLLGRLTAAIRVGRITVDQVRRRVAGAWMDLDRLGTEAEAKEAAEDADDAETTEAEAGDESGSKAGDEPVADTKAGDEDDDDTGTTT